ncbi:Flagellum biosynthesis repressor protein FlbT [hydrothermal vent metagenome]|uniref:Flagellum biosynthesis repressor protein FlbT n=1 Tax=hydrothermal vent metagenome TaxID=652676 RepID=A0A3B0RFR5_9ZZZZ
MPLKLSLKPGEKFVLNGAVIQNGDRRANLVLQNQASILREKDIMQEVEATTPARRVYFPVMVMYLDPDNGEDMYSEFVLKMTEFMSAIKNPEMLSQCVGVSREVMAGNYYRALNKCRKLIAYEEGSLAHVVDSVPKSIQSG